MGRLPSSFLHHVLLVSLFLALFFSHGSGRKVMVTGTEHESSSAKVELVEETHGKSREMIGLMDYGDPKANTNPKMGYLFTPPPQRN